MKKTTNLRPKQAFTLVELLVYMGLLTTLLVILSQIFVSILEIRSESEAAHPLEQDSQAILARLNYDINRATSITTPINPGNTTSNLEIVVGPDTYTYQLNSNNLELVNNFGTNNINSSQTSITNLNFQRLGTGGKDSIKIQFTIESKTRRPGGPETKTYQTTVGLR